MAWTLLFCRKYFTQLFEMADEDGNGVLDAGEVEHLLSLTGAL